MKIALGKFKGFVIAAVMLTGAGFGALTGLVYEEQYWWAGMTAGVVSGFVVANIYLKLLTSTSQKASKTASWLLGTLVAAICGVICTVLVHGVMILITYKPNGNLNESGDGFWAIALMIGIVIGTGAGAVVGGICSLIYVFRIKSKCDEAA